MVFLFLRSLRYRWGEYLLASLVIAVVVATVTVQRSLSASTESQVHDLAHKLGKNMLVVPSETDLADFYAMRYGGAAMPDSHPDKILKSDLRRHISLVQPRLYGNIEPSGVPLVLVGEQTIKRGRVANPFSSDKVTLGETAAERLSLGPSDTLEVNGLKLSVKGVTATPLDGLDVGVFGPLDLAQDVLDRSGEINAMRLAGCWCRVDVPKLASQVEDVLPDARAMTVAGMIKAQKGTVATAKRYSTVTLAVGVLLIAAIVVVLIASQVRRQIREIGFLLATGASPWFIVAIFITKAGIVGIIGGLAGYYLGFPLTEEVASRLIGLPVPVSTDLLGMTLGLSVTVSLLSAFLPAVRAARLDPTAVLREI
jgi:ABC-type antimicrobial peptide transport system permease subunit